MNMNKISGFNRIIKVNLPFVDLELCWIVAIACNGDSSSCMMYINRDHIKSRYDHGVCSLGTIPLVGNTKLCFKRVF